MGYVQDFRVIFNVTSHLFLEQIHATFPFFGTMYEYLCTRPNAIPPIVTTGVGPAGRHVVHFQPVEPVAIPSDNTPTAPILSESQPAAPAIPTPSQPAAGGKRPAKDSSFTVTPALIDKAKGSLQRVVKKSFEERLADAKEFVSFSVLGLINSFLSLSGLM